MKKRAMYFKQIQGGISVKKKIWGGQSPLWTNYPHVTILYENEITTWHLASIHTCTYIMYILRNYHLIARCLLICITLFLPFSEHLFLVLFPPLHPKKTTKISGLKKKSQNYFWFSGRTSSDRYKAARKEVLIDLLR